MQVVRSDVCSRNRIEADPRTCVQNGFSDFRIGNIENSAWKFIYIDGSVNQAIAIRNKPENPDGQGSFQLPHHTLERTVSHHADLADGSCRNNLLEYIGHRSARS